MPQSMTRFCLIFSALFAFLIMPVHAQPDPNRMITRYIRNPPAFNHVDASGMVKVILIQDHTLSPHIALTGPRDAINNVSISISAKTLHVNLPSFDLPERSGNLYPVAVHIYLPHVVSIATAGTAHVNAYFEYQPSPLALYMRGESMARINGLVNVNQIIQSDNSRSHIVFSDSQDINVILHQYSRAYLAGHAHHLYARGDGYAILNGRHMRAEHAWLQNEGHSVAMLSPLTQLDAFATNQANIIAANTSGILQASHYSRDQGNVLYFGA